MSSSSSPIELTILSVKPQDSHVQEKLGIAHSYTFTSNMLLPMCTCTKKKKVIHVIYMYKKDMA